MGGRLGADGLELEAFDPASVTDVPDEVDAVAVCLLHADLNPAHETVVSAALRGRGFDVTASSALAATAGRDRQDLIGLMAVAAMTRMVRPVHTPKLLPGSWRMMTT